MSDQPSEIALQNLMLEGQAAFEEQDWGTAENRFRRCLDQSPGHPSILHNLALVAHRRGDLPEAERLLVEATRAGAGEATMLLLGMIYDADGRHQRAFACFAEVLRLNPRNFDAAFTLGGIKERAGDLAGARECYRAAVEAQPTNIDAVKKYADAIWAEDPARAVEITTGLLQAAGDNMKARSRVLEMLVCQVEWLERMRHGQMPYHATGIDELLFTYALPHLQELEKTNTALLASNSNNGITKIRLGLSRFALGDRAGAEALFQAAPERTAGSIYEAVRFAPAFYDELRSMTDADLTAGLPPCIDVTPPVPDAAGVLYLACDAAYFAAFALPMLCSLRENSPGTPVHLHVMDASVEQIDRILAFCQRLSPVPFALSTERPGLQNAPTMEARCYYHAIRFIRYYEHLQLYKCPLWLTDVDAIVHRDLHDLFAMLGANDVAMRIRPGRLEPWNQFNACVLGTSQSAASRDYHRLIAAYIAYFHKQNGLRWGIDQLAMYGAFANLRDAGRAPTLSLLGEREVDYDYRDDGFIWCNSGVKKFQHLRRIASPEKMPLANFEENRFVVDFERHWHEAKAIAAAVGWAI